MRRALVTIAAGLALLAPAAAGAAPTAVVSPTSMTFASTPVGSMSSGQSVTITNAGPGTLTFNGTNLGVDFDYSSTCSQSLAEGATCYTRIRATPKSTGAKAESYKLFSNAATPIVVAVNVTGVTALPPVAVTEYDVPYSGGSFSRGEDLAAADDGSLWFTDVSNKRVGRFVPSTTTFTIFNLAPLDPDGIYRGYPGTGRMYFMHANRQSYAAIDNSGTVSDNHGPIGFDLGGIAVGANGRVYLSERRVGVDYVGADGRVVRLTPPGATPNFYDIVRGSDERLWIANYNPMEMVAMTLDGTFTRYPVPAAPSVLANAPDGSVLFDGAAYGPQHYSGLGTISPDGSIRIFDQFLGVTAMAYDAAGNLWSTNGTKNITRVRPDGVETRVPVPNFAYSVAKGSDGNVWLLETTGSQGKIARVDVGLAAAATLTPSSADFGSVDVATASAPITFSLRNSGTASLAVSSITTSDPQFAATPQGCATLAPGASCAIDVTATPSATGMQVGTLSVASNAPGSPVTATLTVNGTAPPTRSITATPGTVPCAPVVVLPHGQCSTAAVTVTNGAVAGHVLVAGSDAVGAGGGWALCGGAGTPACGGGPGADQFGAALVSGTTQISLGTTAVADVSFGSGGGAAAGQAVAESLTITAPASTTSSATTFTTGVTWIAAP